MFSSFFDTEQEAWCPEFYRERAALREFRSLRRAARFDRVLVFIRSIRGGPPVEKHPVAGVIDERGLPRNLKRGLPRRMKSGWLALYLLPEPPVERPVRVKLLPSGIYLAGMADLLLFEVLRSKGVRTVLAEPVTVEAVYSAAHSTPVNSECEPNILEGSSACVGGAAGRSRLHGKGESDRQRLSECEDPARCEESACTR